MGRPRALPENIDRHETLLVHQHAQSCSQHVLGRKSTISRRWTIEALLVPLMVLLVILASGASWTALVLFLF